MLYSLISIGPATPYVDLVIAAILIGLIIYTCFKVNLSMKVIIPAIIFIVGLLLSYLFSLTLVPDFCIYEDKSSVLSIVIKAPV